MPSFKVQPTTLLADPVAGLLGYKNPASGVDVAVPAVLSQGAAPIILPSSGSSNASGQITLTTALPYTPTGVVQVYLPAGVVTGDATGGLYRAAFSSTTVCQLAGSPATANAAFTQSTSVVTLASMAVPAGAMGQNGALRIEPLWSMPNNANVKTAIISLGGTTFSSLGSTTIAQDSRTVRIRNRGAEAVNVGFVSGATFTFAPNYGTVDTSANQSLLLRAQLAVATDYMILEGYAVELLPAN